MRAPNIVGIVALAVLGTTGCADGGGTTTPSGDLRLPPLGPDEATVQVFASGGTMADAGIVIETNTGQLIELHTGRMGSVNFEMPEEGIRSLLAHKDGYAFQAISGRRLADMLEAYDGIQLYLPETTAPSKTWVTGTAFGMDSFDHMLTVTANHPASTMFQAQGNTFSLQVETNRPFTLVGLEWNPDGALLTPDQGASQSFYNWAVASHGGTAMPTMMDITFDQSVDVETHRGSFSLPADSVMAAEGRAYIRVTTLESEGKLFLGAPTYIDVSHYELHSRASYFNVDFPEGHSFEIPARDPKERPIIVWTAFSNEAVGDQLAPYLKYQQDVIAAIRGPGFDNIPLEAFEAPALDDHAMTDLPKYKPNSWVEAGGPFPDALIDPSWVEAGGPMPDALDAPSWVAEGAPMPEGLKPGPSWVEQEGPLPYALREGVRAEYEVEHVRLPRYDNVMGQTMMTQYLAWDRIGNVAYALERGTPVEGASDIGLPSVPLVSVDPPPVIHDAVVWEPTGRSLPLTTVAVFDDVGRMIGTMAARSEEGTAHCPPLPSTSNEALVFTGGRLEAVLVSCTPSEGLQSWCARGTQSAPFAVVP